MCGKVGLLTGMRLTMRVLPPMFVILVPVFMQRGCFKARAAKSHIVVQNVRAKGEMFHG